MSDGTDPRAAHPGSTTSRVVGALDAARKNAASVPPGSAQSEGPLDAMRAEILASRELLAALEEVEAALIAAGGLGVLPAKLRSLQERMEEARAASIERRRYLPGPGSLEEWIGTARPADQQAATKLSGEARALRTELDRAARRTAYVARRGVQWAEAQLAGLVEWVVQAADPGGGYGRGPDAGRETVPSWLVNRSA